MKLTVRYLVPKPNRATQTMRYYWQPSKTLKAEGWSTVSLPPDEALAVDRAKALNAELDRWYEAGKPARGSAAGKGKSDGPVVRGTVRDLIKLYREPPEGVHADPEAEKERRAQGIVFGYDYDSLKANTKRSYDRLLDYIDAWLGPLPVRAVTEAIVLERLKTISRQIHEKGPNKGRAKIATANLIGRIGRMLFHASRTLVAPSHPCYVPKASNPWASLRARDRRQTPVLWTKEGRDLMIAAAKQMEWLSMGTAIIINWWLGQREADILSLGHNFNPAVVLELVQGKTAGEVFLPLGVLPEIGAAVTALRADQKERKLSGVRLLIDERNGLLWEEHRFRKAFQDIRLCAVEEALWAIRNKRPGWEDRDAAWVDRHLAQLTYMRLRHTVVTMLNRAGCSLPEIVAITGHTLSSAKTILERYGKRDDITAGNAMTKRLEREGS